MDVKGQLRSVRISPRKVRLATRVLRGMDATHARHQLAYMVKRSSTPVIKLLNSVMANARHNFGMVESNLFVKEVIVDEGSKLKRYRPKGFGSSSPIEKKTSHIRIVLSEKVPGLKADAPVEKDSEKVVAKKDEKVSKRSGTKRDDAAAKGAAGAPVKRRLFQRKTI